MTWEPLAGGGVLALSGVIAALWFKVRELRERNRADRAVNERDLLAGKAEALEKELAGERKAYAEESDKREAVIVAQRLNYAELQRRLEKYEALDPVLAGDHLRDVLLRGPGAKAGPAVGAAGVPADAPADVAPDRRADGRSR